MTIARDLPFDHLGVGAVAEISPVQVQPDKLQVSGNTLEIAEADELVSRYIRVQFGLALAVKVLAYRIEPHGIVANALGHEVWLFRTHVTNCNVGLALQEVTDDVVRYDLDFEIRSRDTQPIEHFGQNVGGCHFGGGDPHQPFDRLVLPRRGKRHLIGAIRHRPDMLDEIEARLCK